MMGDPETEVPEPAPTPEPTPVPLTEEPEEGENGEPEEEAKDDSTTGKLLETLGVERGSVNQRYDGETDPAYVIKMQNQKRVFEQNGLPWPPPEPEPEEPEEPQP